MGQIGNADGTSIWLVMPHNYTGEQKVAKQVPIRTSGCEKQRITVMLGITADRHKLPPFFIFKRNTPPKMPKNAKLFPTDILIQHQEDGWMTHELMLDWLENVWGRLPQAMLNLPLMLCLDALWGHLTDEIKNKIHRLKSELVIIPAGMTSVLQPLGVTVNKPFKARLCEQYNRWI